ncbi:MAG TPA: MFS transporter [Acidimicrobiales bacterium]|jgi:MFS family permease|nr:MFS transporter [Acidimicrobiales bacterium]
MSALRRFTGETFRSLHVRNFRLFFSGQLISQVGNWLTLVAQTLLVLKLTDSGIALGLLAVAQFGPVLVLGPFAGLVADRSDKRKLLLTVQTLAMLQSFCLAVLVFSGHPSVMAIYGVALLGGFTVAFDNPARRAFVVEMVPEEDIGNAVSLNSALMTGSRVVGPALAGLLITTVGFGWCFLLDGLSYLAVLAGLWLIDPSVLRSAPVARRGRGQVREGLRYARSVPELWIPLLMMAVIGTLAFNFQTVLPLFVTRDLAGSDVTFTLLMSVVSAGSLVGALATARRKRISIHTVGVTAVAFGVAMGALALAPNQPVAFAIGLLMGTSSIAFMTASTAIVQLTATPSMRGRVLALQAMVFLGSTPIGGPIVGTISQRFGARYSLALGAVATVLAGGFGLLTVRSRARRDGAVDELLAPADTGALVEPSLLDPLITPRAS